MIYANSGIAAKCLLLLIIALPSDFLNKSAPYIFRISLVYFWDSFGILLKNIPIWDYFLSLEIPFVSVF